MVLLGHSKGAVDAAAALSLFPELGDFVAGLVSLQVLRPCPRRATTASREPARRG